MCPYYNEKYESVMHESGHSIDRAISRKFGSRYSENYNDGEFQKTLEREGTQYIKNFQKDLVSRYGRKVPLDEARRILSMRMVTETYKVTGDVSDILGGVTKGKFSGSGGHPKKYWTGEKDYWGNVRGAHSVSVEAFAEMFSASTTNSGSLAKIKEVFPESYKVFTKMLAEAANL